jgi:subtilisin family serine protease
MSDQPTFGGAPRLDHVPGQIVLRVSDEAVRPYVEPGAGMRVDVARRLPETVTEPLDYLRREAGARAVRPLFVPKRIRARIRRASTRGGRALPTRERQRMAVVASVTESESEELAGLTLVEVPQKEVSPELLRKVSRSPAIEFAEPMPARWLTRAQTSEPTANRQWGLRAIHWYQADLPRAEDVTVAVLDTGIDAAHPDLRSLDITYRYEGLSSRDIVGHGTHVSGIISATTNNDVGINGVTRCKLAVFKVFPDEPAADGEYYVDGARYLRALNSVIDCGAKVLNLSLGGSVRSDAEQLLFNRLERFGVTVVAAMGNEYNVGNPKEYPAGYDNVFAVGATAETDLRSAFSNTGRHIQLVAPGSNILSTLPTTRSAYRGDAVDYAAWSGTSMATPHVAAAAALLAARHRDWAPDDIKQQLIETARKLPDMRSKRFTQAYGNGLLDLERALS